MWLGGAVAANVISTWEVAETRVKTPMRVSNGLYVAGHRGSHSRLLTGPANLVAHDNRIQELGGRGGYIPCSLAAVYRADARASTGFTPLGLRLAFDGSRLGGQGQCAPDAQWASCLVFMAARGRIYGHGLGQPQLPLPNNRVGDPVAALGAGGIYMTF